MIYQVTEQLMPYHPITGLQYGRTACRIIRERRSLERAIADANGNDARAVVTELHCGVVLHDNGKDPRRVDYDFATGRAAGANTL